MAPCLTETSQSTSGMIDRQFAGIRTNIEQESESMAVAMRAACEQANAELEGILGQTTERFQSAAAELRGMSREIQRELESTREALHRGAVELPQETAQQAASMRRAVADQIKALEELSEIVTRSGRSYDVSQPAPYHRWPRRSAGRAPARGTNARGNGFAAGSRAASHGSRKDRAPPPSRPMRKRPNVAGAGSPTSSRASTVMNPAPRLPQLLRSKPRNRRNGSKRFLSMSRR